MKNKQTKTAVEKESCKVSSIGGQALYEGVMMQSKGAVAISVRDEQGDILEYAERVKSKQGFFSRLFILRGFIAFIKSLLSGIKYISKSIEPMGDEDEQLTAGEMALSVILGLVLSIGLFSILPRVINWLILDLVFNLAVSTAGETYLYVLANSLVSGLLRICILVLYMYGVSKLKSIKRMFQYHGAEHRTINCYEKGLDLTVENVQSQSVRHNRCGTTFLFYTVLVSILVSIAVAFILAVFGVDVTAMIAYVGNDTWGTMLYNVILIGLNLVVLPLTSGLSYELLKFMAKMPDNAFFMIFKAPGLMLQKLSTKIPEDEMAECAISAFKNVMQLDADPNAPNKDFYDMTMAGANEYIKEKFSKAGDIEECEVDWLLCAVLKVQRSELRQIEKLTDEQCKLMRKWCAKRTSGVPLDYVIGESEFYGLKIKVSEDVLIPRMDTEQVVLSALNIIGESKFKVLDLMTGSGCIAKVINEKTNADVTALDKSIKALAIAKENCGAEVKYIESDCFSNVTEKYDLIISNPPYICTSDIEALQQEVKCQPNMALDGGVDGLEFYKIIAENACEYLNEKGHLVLEIGYNQASDVMALLEAKFEQITLKQDLSGVDRVITAVKK